MKVFRFQKFSLNQHPEVFAIGTDGVLLGAMVNLYKAKKILEVGPGTGLISLMLAQRFPKVDILGVEVDPIATQLCSKNFAQSPFANRLCVKESAIQIFETNEIFDALVCNPPFFLPNLSTKHSIARQQIHLNYRDLFSAGQKFLTDQGSLHLIYPAQDEEKVKDQAYGFGLKEQILIRGIANGPIIRKLQHWKKGFSGETKTSEFCVEVSPRQYSSEYLSITRDFHIFKNNKGV